MPKKLLRDNEGPKITPNMAIQFRNLLLYVGYDEADYISEVLKPDYGINSIEELSVKSFKNKCHNLWDLGL